MIFLKLDRVGNNEDKKEGGNIKGGNKTFVPKQFWVLTFSILTDFDSEKW